MRKMLCSLLAIALLAILPAGCRTTVAPDDDDPTAFEVRVSPGSALRTRTGTSTGTEAAGVCGGFIPANPNHQLVVTGSSVTGMRVEAVSDDDVILRIEFGQSTFCGDGETPTVERGSWSVGTYDIFVGSPTEGATVTYTLRFVE
jgi:hypothetical protein